MDRGAHDGVSNGVPEYRLLPIRHDLVQASRQTEPPRGFGIVLRDAAALDIREPEVDLRLGVSLLGGQADGLNVRGLCLIKQMVFLRKDLTDHVALKGGLAVA